MWFLSYSLVVRFDRIECSHSHSHSNSHSELYCTDRIFAGRTILRCVAFALSRVAVNRTTAEHNLCAPEELLALIALEYFVRFCCTVFTFHQQQRHCGSTRTVH